MKMADENPPLFQRLLNILTQMTKLPELLHQAKDFDPN